MADCDLNLDFLTKEEREALLSKKMDMIRQRNRAISERHEMIQADKRKAEETGNAVKALDSKTVPAEGGANKTRGRGRGQPAHKDASRPAKERPKSHGDFRDASSYEPVVDFSELNNHKGDYKGKGSRPHPPKQDFENDFGSTPKNRRKPQAKDEASSRDSRPVASVSFDYEPIVDMRDLDKRFGPSTINNNNNNKSVAATTRDQSFHSGHQRSNRQPKAPEENNNTKAYDGRLKGASGPPPDPSFNPLADRRRAAEKREEQDHKRHPRNYGGGAELSRVKENMKSNREKEKGRPVTAKPLEISMTGRERKNHQEWKQERERYDKERIQRQLNDGGNWRREWDNDKVVLEYEDSMKIEPAKRPAGRIGSGRFDRGERDDRSRGTAREVKGGLQVQTSQPHHSTQPPQATAPVAAPLSPQPSPQHGDNKGARGGARGRGRGRGRGKGAGGPPGDKSPRPRTWSGGDDRLVECQKEMLLVKFENIAGDNTVEVEYDNVRPRSKSGSTNSQGRGSSGRGQNQVSSKPRGAGKPQPHQNKQNKLPKGKGGSRSSQPDQQDQFLDADWDVGHPTIPHSKSEEFRVRTSSHSQSYGDSEEWEDCTGSSGMQEDDDESGGRGKRISAAHGQQDLHLECSLNPEAPEFLPTSPNFLKTPPGHVKVLNWAAGSNSPTSPRSVSLTSPLSSHPPSVTSPSATSPLVTSPGPFNSSHLSGQVDADSDSASMSSPGSSASTRAKNRREACDEMPEPDQPCPPPFLMEDGAGSEKMKAGKDLASEKVDENHNNEDEGEEGAETFEDTVDALGESHTQEKSEDVVPEQTNGLLKDVTKESKDESLDQELQGELCTDSKPQSDIPLNSITNNEKPQSNDKDNETEACVSGLSEDTTESSPPSQERQQEMITDTGVGEREDACDEQVTPVENVNTCNETPVENVNACNEQVTAVDNINAMENVNACDEHVTPVDNGEACDKQVTPVDNVDACDQQVTPVVNVDVSDTKTVAEVETAISSGKIDMSTTKAEVSADTSESQDSSPTAEESAPS